MAFTPRTSRRIRPEVLKKLRDKLRQRAIEEHEARLKQYPWPEERDGFHPHPILFPDYPGYYRVPIKTDFLIINESGHVIRFTTGKEVKQNISKKGYPVIPVRVGVSKTYPFLVHRLVALLFCAVPIEHLDKDREDLQVNHIDAVKTNNHYTNLEWVTSQENMQHMLEVVRIDHPVPVIAKNVETGEIRTYPTIKQCAVDHMLGQVSLRAHVLGPAAGRIPIEGWLFKKNDGAEWPFFVVHSNSKQLLSTVCDVVARHEETGEVHLFLTLTDACDVLGFKRGDLKNHRIRKGVDVPFRGWIFYPFSEESIKRRGRNALPSNK